MLVAENLLHATFLERPNRFLGIVDLGTKTVQCFIPNPGRMQELLIPHKKVWLVQVSQGARKTAYDLIAVDHAERIVSIDSRLPNKFLLELFKTQQLLALKFDEIKPEFPYQNSRFDFFLRHGSQKFLVEVKSCTLVEDSIALFPDAPTKRGARHAFELAHAMQHGYQSIIFFLIQRDDAIQFRPFEENDPHFSSQLRYAKQKGVIIRAFTSEVYIRDNALYIELSREIEVLL